MSEITASEQIRLNLLSIVNHVTAAVKEAIQEAIETLAPFDAKLTS